MKGSPFYFYTSVKLYKLNNQNITNKSKILAYNWYVLWRQTIVTIKTKDYGFIFNRIYHLPFKWNRLLLAFFQMYRLVRENIKRR